MQITKNDLEKSQLEFTVELPWEEFEPYLIKGAEKLSSEMKIEGFRPGKAPYDLVKQKVGEITILEEAANIAINKTIVSVLSGEKEKTLIGRPEIRLTKLAQGNPMEYKIVISFIPEIKLHDFKALPVKAEKPEVTEKDVEGTLEQLREMRTREQLTDHEAKDTDKVTLDIEMFLDKVPVEGGQAKEVAIILGKKLIVPGFDKQVIGMKAGDVREFSLPYPEKHFQANLAGKIVEFRVSLKQVFERIIPQADDDFAKGMQFNSMDDMKEQIKKNIEREKQMQAQQKTEAEMISLIIEKSRFGDIPEFLIKEEAHGILHEIEHDIERQGGKFPDYLASIKKTHDEMLVDLMPEAVKRIKTILAIREIARLENISVDEKDLDAEIAKSLDQYKSDPEVQQRIKSPEYRDSLRSAMLNRKVIDKLKDWNLKKGTEKDKEKKEEKS